MKHQLSFFSFYRLGLHDQHLCIVCYSARNALRRSISVYLPVTAQLQLWHSFTNRGPRVSARCRWVACGCLYEVKR